MIFVPLEVPRDSTCSRVEKHAIENFPEIQSAFSEFFGWPRAVGDISEPGKVAGAMYFGRS